jgi:hypothetical protein
MRSGAVWLLLLLASGASASACTLSFKPSFQTTPGRIAAIELALQHGAVTGLRTVPVGWQFIINNDPSWITKAAGHAIVGAAFLAPSALSALFSIEPEPGHTCSELATRGFLKLKLKFYQGDRLHNTVVNQTSVMLMD